MKVAVLGPKGTFTHQAAEEFFDAEVGRDKYELVFCSTISEAVEQDTDATVIPFENSLRGGITESIDLFKEKENIEIIGEKVIPVRHFLLSKDKIEDIEVVRSHPQALNQCKDFLSKQNWKLKETSSTAKAAQEIGGREAAVASKFAGDLNNLDILEKDIQERITNETKFFILGHTKWRPSKREKTSLIIVPGEDRPGLLESMLSCFSGHGINLSYIQSRPTKESLGEYFFFIETEADFKSDKFKKALQCLKTYADVKVLGSYKSDK